LRNADSTIRGQWSGRPRSALTDDVDSVKELILSQKGAPVTEPHVRFHERQELITLRYTVSLVRIWSWNAWRSVVRKNSLLQTVHCTKRAQNWNYYVVFQHSLWTSYF